MRKNDIIQKIYEKQDKNNAKTNQKLKINCKEIHFLIVYSSYKDII